MEPDLLISGKQPNRFATWMKNRTGKMTALGLIALVAVGIAAGVAYGRYAKSRTADNASDTPVVLDFGTKTSSPTDAKVAADLDGTSVLPDHAKRRPLAVMVENHPEARPQSGLNKASVVFEAITEGGITRFMAVFGPQDADKIGPVRSARPYFVQYASGYKAIYAHAGGSEAGLAILRTAPVVNLNDTVGYFHREPKAGLASEHTLYTSSENLYKLAQKQKASLEEDFTPWKFGDDPSTSDRPASQTASIDFSTVSYKVGWAYDPANDQYNRSLAGSAHKDAVTGVQLTAENVMILSVVRHQDPSANHGKGEWTMDTIGSGKVRILTHGHTVEGTWKKPALDAMLRFFDNEGNELSLGRGRTWVEIVPPDVSVTIE